MNKNKFAEESLRGTFQSLIIICIFVFQYATKEKAFGHQGHVVRGALTAIG
jgi:hypothetical protein